MAKAGAPSKAVARGSDRSDLTRRSLVVAAIESLKIDGYTGASARVIAKRAGVNQGLVFYHFGSVANLLLAALDAVSEERLSIYGTEVAEATSPSQLVDAAEGIFKTDLDAGYITVLVEMIAGSSSTPGLGPEVASRIQPWREFAQSSIESALSDSPLSSVLPARDVAHAIVALYLGLEMLSHLDGDAEPALALFAHAKQLASRFEAMTTPATTKEST
ncbi:MAG TPA: TetR/AcrR family transcriptional regulator [Acidimicrobiales bacterium]|nr:TetR/AcrR family transcriptional regulator [Acidimicrobiales bacterium]